MYLERLELADFRSYAAASLTFGPGVTVIVGANAQGKTNLLEAVHWLGVGASHRVSSDAPLVRTGAEAAVIRAVARVATDPDVTDTDEPGTGAVAAGAGRRLTVEVELRPGGRSRARLNGQPQPRVRDVVGLVRSVLFAPEDLTLVRGDPADRRRFLDELLAQRRPAYHAQRQEYERIVRQRNALLKQVRSSGWSSALDATLEAWTDAFVHAASTLLAARIAAVHALAGPTAAAYTELVVGAPGGKDATVARLTYELATGREIVGTPGGGVPDPGALAEELRAGLAAVAHAERERGVTLVGPHRDELRLALGDLPAKGYASHGESWSLALALKLASREVLREVGEEPIVLLDDVFAELDEVRRTMLAERCRHFEQVLVTAAVEADVPLVGPRYRIEGGTATADGREAS